MNELEMFEDKMMPENNLVAFKKSSNRYLPVDESNPTAINLACDANLAWHTWQVRATLDKGVEK